jgi:hypothetical protein
MTKVDLSKLRSPVLLEGDAQTAYRDATATYHDGVFYLYVSVVTTDRDGLAYWQTAWSRSTDLVEWTPPRCFTPRDRTKNFSSPGNVIRDGTDFALCLQTYPTPLRLDKHGDHNSRVWIMRGEDLEHWREPELLQVEGPTVPREEMSRVIDPYLVRDKDVPGVWWCFYKKKRQVCYSRAPDLKTWQPAGVAARGENPCVIVDGDEYVLFYSPLDGINVMRSRDLKTWRDCGSLTLGVQEWDWAQGRLSAGFVLDLRNDPRVGKALLIFHGSRWPEDDPRGGWANWVSLGIAWSDDLEHWDWPGRRSGQ